MDQSAGRRLLPVTTASGDARRRFEAGRHAAFHYQPTQAREYLDAAIAADPAFVLAYLHRGGMSLPSERGEYFDLARGNRDRVTEDEGGWSTPSTPSFGTGMSRKRSSSSATWPTDTMTTPNCPRTLACATYAAWATWTGLRSSSNGPPAVTCPSPRRTTGWDRWRRNRETPLHVDVRSLRG